MSNNIYNHHLEQLRKMKSNDLPATSLYIPLRWTDFTPTKIFTALMKAANNLLLKGGHPKLEVMMPEWDRWIMQGTVTLGLFHQNGVTSLIPLPVKMQPRVIVAKTFHVKPIVTASKEYIDSLMLHFNESGASLFRVTPVGESIIDTYILSSTLTKTDWPGVLERQSLRDFLEFLQHELKGTIKDTTKIIGVTGAAFPELQSESFWRRIGLPVIFYNDHFRSAVPHNGMSMLRLRLSQIINETHTKSVLKSIENSKRHDGDLSLNNLLPKIANKEINHLCVSLDSMVFGEIDFKTGEVMLNKNQENIFDDDLLDDLVEIALDKGIEVSVVPKKFLPVSKNFVVS